jgi:hypothetical protein
MILKSHKLWPSDSKQEIYYVVFEMHLICFISEKYFSILQDNNLLSMKSNPNYRRQCEKLV